MESSTQITYPGGDCSREPKGVGDSFRIFLGTQFFVRKICFLLSVEYCPPKYCIPIQPISSKCLHIRGTKHFKHFIHEYTIFFLMRLIMENNHYLNLWTFNIGVKFHLEYWTRYDIGHFHFIYVSIMWQIKSPPYLKGAPPLIHNIFMKCL